ncbi:MAG: hypothetical protein KF752_08555 [Pirellulaceae bacterium]|nr:hypothetical protein [Pirellulaceae bacterium]
MIPEPENASWVVPREHGGTLVSPPVEQLTEIIRNQAYRGRNSPPEVYYCGRSLADLRGAARASLLALAREYTASYLPTLATLSELSNRPIIMSGHQPELFHCGVWFKNFLLSRLAQVSGGVGIHFIVDNDLCRSTAIAVPVQQSGQWHIQSIDFDTPGVSVPWETRQLVDQAVWRSFARRAQAVLPQMPEPPVLERLWRYAEMRADATNHLPWMLSQARHQLESEFGLSTLEVPLSQLADTPEFAYFSVELLSQLSRLHAVYNRQLELFRAEHRIRNRAQPLPDLESQDDWLETPWWCYSTASPLRLPLWARHTAAGIQLSNRADWQAMLTATPGTSGAAEQWLEIQSTGVKLRPRALLTTMFVRTILCDLMIHGIGGARYDQLTDGIIRELWRIEAPPFAVATATLHLPFMQPDDLIDIDALLATRQSQLRMAQSNPEAVLTHDGLGNDKALHSQLERLLQEKRNLLAAVPDKGQKWEWHHTLQHINHQLKQLALPHIERLTADIQQLNQQKTQQSICRSREFSFCLFDEQTIRRYLLVDPRIAT